jgi:acetyl-CoA hydrolase
VTTLKQGAGVITTRNHVHYVVTEYGVADLYGKTIRERAHALINVAHPDFKDQLTKEAQELHYI